MDGRATFTTETSSTTMNCATQAMAKMMESRRFVSGEVSGEDMAQIIRAESHSSDGEHPSGGKSFAWGQIPAKYLQ